MFKTLALLAVSMTATTVILTHLEPAASPTLPYPLPERIQYSIRSALAAERPVVPDVWYRVEIIWQREVAYHFRVEEGGEVSSSRAWREQRAVDADGAIRVALADRRADAALPILQWSALRLLLIELRGVAFGPGAVAEGAADWVILSDEAVRDTALQARLHSEGLHG